MSAWQNYLDGFGEDAGFLNYAGAGALSRAAVDEQTAWIQLFARMRAGALDAFGAQDGRFRAACGTLLGMPEESVVFEPGTSQGLFTVLFGLSGTVLVAPGEFPAVTIAAARAAAARPDLTVRAIETGADGRVSAKRIAAALDDEVTAVLVSHVDGRTGYRTDLEAIRAVIGDRLLLVDAIQSLGAIDAPYAVADAVCAGGQKWLRSGFGGGLLALSERAQDVLEPVLSGHVGTSHEGLPWDETPPPAAGARGFVLGTPNVVAQAVAAASIEETNAAGITAVHAAVLANSARMIELADEFQLPVISPRAETERAGIVILEPLPERRATLSAAFHNHGITATERSGRIRLSAHAGTRADTMTVLREALTEYRGAIGS